mmetsp:Transcript_22400/g.40168  ORF Transcript_22400/g.40168 Transcript_22400/m.40168 type:complete len:81 (-) Transcript_22400:348-590(-)
MMEILSRSGGDERSVIQFYRKRIPCYTMQSLPAPKVLAFSESGYMKNYNQFPIAVGIPNGGHHCLDSSSFRLISKHTMYP